MVEITLLEEAEMNANEMSSEAFARLKENIRISGGLSSSIACYRKADTGRFVIISGHHRYRACVQLRYKEVPVIYAEESDLTKDEIIALQLSHNSLHGEDNKGILKRLFSEIEGVQFKEMSYIDLTEIQPMSLEGASVSIEKEQYSVSLVLYRNALDNLESLIGAINEESNRNDIVLLADGSENEDEFLALTTAIRKVYDIKSPSIQFSKILELAKRQLEIDAAANGKD